MLLYDETLETLGAGECILIWEGWNLWRPKDRIYDGPPGLFWSWCIHTFSLLFSHTQSIYSYKGYIGRLSGEPDLIAQALSKHRVFSGGWRKRSQRYFGLLGRKTHPCCELPMRAT